MNGWFQRPGDRPAGTPILQLHDQPQAVYPLRPSWGRWLLRRMAITARSLKLCSLWRSKALMAGSLRRRSIYITPMGVPSMRMGLAKMARAGGLPKFFLHELAVLGTRLGADQIFLSMGQ